MPGGFPGAPTDDRKLLTDDPKLLSKMRDELIKRTEVTEDSVDAPGNIDFSQMRDRSIKVTEVTEDSGNIDFSQMRGRPISPRPPISGPSGSVPGGIDFRQEIQYTRRDHPIDIDVAGDESSKPCIFKVPDILRRQNPESFTPNSFSFGPLYHAQEHLKEAEEIKKHYLHELLSRKPTPQTTKDEFMRSILEVEGRARKCYAFPTDHLNQEEFVEMLILDGCFIVELLRNKEINRKRNYKDNYYNNNYNCCGRNSRNNNRNKYDYTIDKNDPVFSVNWVLQVLYHDLILLENQIPWFVLVRLFDMTTSSTIYFSTKSLTGLALDFFGTIFTVKALLPKIEGRLKINHLLDLLRNVLGASIGAGQESTGDWQQIPTATTLKELGIRFKRGRSSNRLDIKFSFRNGVLEIPSLLIQEITCDAFRNFISYEQCYTSCEPRIISYTILLKNLISTTKDIELLCKTGIFDNRLNLNDTLEFFKNIYTDTYEGNFYYLEICEQIEDFTNRWWPRTRAAYVRMFWDPIGSLSLFAAAIALILTLLQTLFTILQYIESFKPTSRSP